MLGEDHVTRRFALTVRTERRGEEMRKWAWWGVPEEETQ